MCEGSISTDFALAGGSYQIWTCWECPVFSTTQCRTLTRNTELVFSYEDEGLKALRDLQTELQRTLQDDYDEDRTEAQLETIFTIIAMQ